MSKKKSPPAKKAAATKAPAKGNGTPAKAAPAKAATKKVDTKVDKKAEAAAAKKAEAAAAAAAKKTGKKAANKTNPKVELASETTDGATGKAGKPGKKPFRGYDKAARRAAAKASDAEADAMEAAEAKVRKPKKIKPGSALVVVESPAKAKTINKYLGANYIVKASVGHVRDLPKSKIGVDLEEGTFDPVYEVIEGKKKVVAEIRKAAREVETVYLASDPDREGEAIAWHISEEIKDVNTNMRRVLINEITKKGVTAAIANPLDIDMNKTDAQQARRILDRLVGYKISPILWNKVQRGLSAGRVQSVAVRLVCEREEEIKAFIPEEYWSVDITCQGPTPPPFEARIWKWKGEKAEPKTKDEADAIANELRAGNAVVASVDKKERRKKPQAPFITSRLQQDAAQAAVLGEAHDGARPAPLRRCRARR